MSKVQVLVCAVLFIRSSIATDVAYYSVLYDVVLNNTSNSNVVQSGSTSLCAASCSTSSCSAAQYNSDDGSCTMTYGYSCPLTSLQSGSSKVTLLNTNYYRAVSGLPAPMLEWMMTDTCLTYNTGWSNTGARLRPYTYTMDTLWPTSYNVSTGGKFGNAIWYPNEVNKILLSVPLNLLLDFSKSLTFFAYFWLYDTPNLFCLFEFSNGLPYALSTLGPSMWYNTNGFVMNFNFAGCSGDCNSYFYYVNPTLFTWIQVAMVYNASSQSFQAYYNGQNVWTSAGQTTFSSNYTVNSVVSAGRKTNGKLPGSIYCIRFFQAALNADAINAVANSCQLPTFLLNP